MASEPRTIKGPCFDCDIRACWCGCACNSPMGERTEPTAKIEPDELRPNVPPSGILRVYYDGITGEWLNAVMSSALDGALWSVRETPADPFEEVVT